MKRRIFIFVAFLAICIVGYCQSEFVADTSGTAQQRREDGSASFGIRLGVGPDQSGEVAFTWHKRLSKYRLETNLGFATSDKWLYMSVSAAFHWHWHISNGLCWYVGPGLNLGWYFKDNHFGSGIGAQIGIEYNFSFPLQLSLDIFPLYNFIGLDETRGLGGSGGLSVRYRF